MTSRAETVELALEVLGKLIAGEPTGDVENSVVDRRVEYAVAELSSRNVYVISDIDSISDDAVVPFSEYLAAICAPVFNVSAIRGVPVDQFRLQAEQRLRKLGQTDTYGFVVKRDYF